MISITPAAGNTTKGNIAATAHGSGCVIHQTTAQAKVASVTCPAYGNAVCNGAIITSAKAAGPERSFSRYAAVDAVRAVGGGATVSVIIWDPWIDRILKTALVTRGHTKALKDGTVKPRSFDFEFEEVPTIINAFRRMVRGLEFDISEMAITTYLCARAHGKAFTAIPVFPMRAFHHGAILHNVKAGIRNPKDLEGQRVGVNRGYTVTTGVWARSILSISTGGSQPDYLGVVGR